MTDDVGSVDRAVISLLAVAALFVAVAAAASLAGASPFAESLQPDEALAEDERTTGPDLSTGQLGALVDAQAEAAEEEDEPIFDEDDREELEEREDVDDELVDAVERALDEADADSLEEAATQEGEDAPVDEDEAVEGAADEIQESVEDEVDEDVDEETLKEVLEHAFTDDGSDEEQDADEETAEAEGDVDDGDGEAEGDVGDAGRQADGVDDGEEGDVASEEAEDGEGDERYTEDEDEAAAGDVETPSPADDLPGGVAVLAALALFAAVGLVFYAVRREEPTLEVLKNLPRHLMESTVAASFSAAEYVRDAVAGVRGSSSPLEALASLWTLTRERVGNLLSRDTRAPEEMAADVTERAESESPEGGSSSVELIRDSWAVVTRASGLNAPERRTPGEVSRAAVSRGLPREPVQEVTDAFREVEYGGGDPDVGADRVRRAMTEIRDAAGGG